MAAAGRGILITGMTAYLFYDHWAAWILMVPIALLYVKNWEEECCEQKKEEFREQFREIVRNFKSRVFCGKCNPGNVERNLPHLQEKNKNYKGI